MKGRMLASRYRIEAPLGAGGTSTVWSAKDLRLDAPVAVKLLDPAIAGDELSLERFLREAKTSAKLKNRHVVQSLDCGVDGGVPFIVMELLEGITLRARLKERGRLSSVDTASILLDVARGIQAAHTAGIVHRDLKPENVFLVKEDDVEYAKILDFGIAKRTATQGNTVSLGLTVPGSLFGTPNYMSPEQIDARSPIDHRTDIWSMAIVAFECLTGRVPFGEATLREQLLAICARPLPVPSEVADVPPGFDEWFARAAAQDLALRFSSVKEAIGDLSRICGHAPQSLGPPAEPQREAATPNAESRGASTTSSETQQGIDVKPLPLRSWGWLVLLGVVGIVVATAIGRKNSQSTWSSSPNAPGVSSAAPHDFIHVTTAQSMPKSPDTMPTAPTSLATIAPLSPLSADVATMATTLGIAGSPPTHRPNSTSAKMPREPDLLSRAVRR